MKSLRRGIIVFGRREDDVEDPAPNLGACRANLIFRLGVG